MTMMLAKVLVDSPLYLLCGGVRHRNRLVHDQFIGTSDLQLGKSSRHVMRDANLDRVIRYADNVDDSLRHALVIP